MTGIAHQTCGAHVTRASCPISTSEPRALQRHVGPLWAEDFVDEAFLEAVEQFRQSLAEFEFSFFGVEAEDIVEDDFLFGLLWPVS